MHDHFAVEVELVDLHEESHQRAVRNLINAYASDPMGNGEPLSEDVLERLVPGLREQPGALVFLAFHLGTPIGVAVCFLGYSTFAAKPLINVHDLAVLEEHRGRGVGRHLLDAVAREAMHRGCCKITLEVLEGNHRARTLYEALGFEQPDYNLDAGQTLFLAKKL